MKIQSLAIMFIILILPISIVLSTYTQNRIETLSLQTQYDSKLNGATYDALKAYQLNSFNNATGSLTNSKMRDVKASVNTFFNSLATNFSTIGYTQETLQNYVPAVVYTMYDGYYIYSPYTNTWDTETIEKHSNDISYSNGEELYGLKPYVYYSCRYKKDGFYDVVITYSLDNYIAIQGTVKGETVSKYGYLLSGVNSTNGIAYNGIKIEPEEILSESVCVDGNVNEYKYIKLKGTKYYKSRTNNNVFTVVNGKAIMQSNFTFPEKDERAVKYYEEALEMYNFIKDNGLDEIKTTDAVDIDGKNFTDENNPYTKVRKNI